MTELTEENALNALKALNLHRPASDQAGVIKLLATFIVALNKVQNTASFTSKVFASWARSYCLLESLDVPAELKNNYAIGKFLKLYAQKPGALITVAGSYGNRILYKENVR